MTTCCARFPKVRSRCSKIRASKDSHRTLRGGPEPDAASVASRTNDPGASASDSSHRARLTSSRKGNETSTPSPLHSTAPAREPPSATSSATTPSSSPSSHSSAWARSHFSAFSASGVCGVTAKPHSKRTRENVQTSSSATHRASRCETKALSETNARLAKPENSKATPASVGRMDMSLRARGAHFRAPAAPKLFSAARTPSSASPPFPRAGA
mmetsp:Transcript_14036/g.48844  ORF Transcript_14036/g.48844 Transcript_14036/m.48844 type:complete len:213 (+) Transcript_14036:828-1466(+)